MRGTKKVVIFGLVTILLLLAISSAQAGVMGKTMGEQSPTREINVGGNGPNPLWPLPRIPEPEAEEETLLIRPFIPPPEIPKPEAKLAPTPDDDAFPVKVKQAPASGLGSIQPEPKFPVESEQATLLRRPLIPPRIPELEEKRVPVPDDELSEIEPELIPTIPEPEKKRVPSPTGIPEPEKEPAPNPDNDKFPTKAEIIRMPLLWRLRLSQWKDVFFALK